MPSKILVLAGVSLALGLAGCKSTSSPASDSAAGDAPAATDTSRNDAAGDVAIDAKADGAAAATDELLARDASGVDTMADLLGPDIAPAADIAPVADVLLAPDGKVADVPTSDGPPAEAPTADSPAADVRAAEGPPADAPAADSPGRDTGNDSGCAGWSTLKRLSPAEAADLIATSNPIVINVHIPYAGDIPGTDTSIPYNSVDAIEAYLNHDHCADLLLVCLSGGMSQSAGNELIKRGYLRVRDLSGGMQAWEAAGYTLLKDGGA